VRFRGSLRDWTLKAVDTVLGVLLLLHAAGCVSKPYVAGTNLAPPRLRCDHRDDRECDEIRAAYLSGETTFTCTGPDLRCRKPIVVPDGHYFSDQSLKYKFGEERGHAGGGPGTGHPYDLGVALAGGGTKAASYAMGVLAALYDPSNRQLSERVDVISSVSGGSYAALWYFARLLDMYQITNEHDGKAPYSFTDSFADCLPTSYGAIAPDAPSDGDPAACPGTTSQYDPDTMPHDSGTLPADRFRFQNQIRGYHDVFAKDFDLDAPVDKSNHGAALQGVKEAILTLPILPAHWIANGLLDTETNLSFSGRRYFNGIARTYGYRPVDCRDFPTALEETGVEGWRSVCAGASGRPSPNTEAARGHTMSALANLYYGDENARAAARDPRQLTLPRIPFWIANTTAGVERNGFDFSSESRPDLEDSVFEFTPYSFGSRHYGRWVGTPTNAELAKVAGASGAFLDGQQRTLDTSTNAMLWALMRIFALNWGVSIPNPRWRDEVRTVHQLLPFPLYYWHYHKATNAGAWIHLSDGGMSEDLGAWSLVRRGVRTMLIADESYDGEGRMEDVCYLRKQLADRRLYLNLPDLRRLDEVCADEGKRSGFLRYNLWNWRLKYVRGCITTDPNDQRCEKPDREYFSRVFIFKPAIDVATLAPYLAKCSMEEIQHRRNQTPGVCRKAFESLRKLKAYRYFPSELFGFLVRNPPSGPNPAPGQFPQDTTKAMTLHSSPMLYGAYRELARWQMHGIVDEIEGRSTEVEEAVEPVPH